MFYYAVAFVVVVAFAVCVCCQALSKGQTRPHNVTYTHTHRRLKVIQLMGSSSVEHSPSRVNKFNAMASSPSPANNQQGAPVAVPWTLTRLALCLCSCMPHGHAHTYMCELRQRRHISFLLGYACTRLSVEHISQVKKP